MTQDHKTPAVATSANPLFPLSPQAVRDLLERGDAGQGADTGARS